MRIPSRALLRGMPKASAILLLDEAEREARAGLGVTDRSHGAAHLHARVDQRLRRIRRLREELGLSED
jgi:hypothetical protein